MPIEHLNWKILVWGKKMNVQYAVRKWNENQIKNGRLLFLVDIDFVRHARETFVPGKMDIIKEFVQIVGLILNKFSLYMTLDVPGHTDGHVWPPDGCKDRDGFIKQVYLYSLYNSLNCFLSLNLWILSLKIKIINVSRSNLVNIWSNLLQPVEEHLKKRFQCACTVVILKYFLNVLLQSR